jgi:hypothetical protein
MRDNLLFYNMPEESDENTTAMIHKLLEEKLWVRGCCNENKNRPFSSLGKKEMGRNKSAHNCRKVQLSSG